MPLAHHAYDPPGGSLSSDPRSNVEQTVHEDRVRKAKEYIRDGDAFQIVLAQRFSRQTEASPLQIYRALRATNPSPYMFLLEFSEDLTLVGASPEMLVRLEDGIAYNRPLAGTRHRGASEKEDLALEEELLNDPKERAEHVMLVDLGRNDLGRVCDYGTVQVKKMMYVERYSHVMHIVPARSKGCCARAWTPLILLRATFPAGTLSGAPKVRAMEIIEELEETRRGPYGGAVGYFSFDGSMDMCITIRTLLDAKRHDQRASRRRHRGRQRPDRRILRDDQQSQGGVRSGQIRRKRPDVGAAATQRGAVMILVIDNYDSFTYNVVQELGELGADLTVYRNDKITVDEIRAAGAGTHRDLARARLPGGRRRVAGCDSTAGRGDSAARHLPGASSHRRSLWRRGRISRAGIDARQDQHDLSRRRYHHVRHPQSL